MNKTKLTFGKAALLFCITAITLVVVGQNKPQQKQYTVTLSIDQWKEVIGVIDKSNAEHLMVKAVQDLIVVQLQKQLADTTNKKK